MGDIINENPTLFLALIVAVVVVILILLIVGSVKRNAQKKRLLAENANLVELVFDVMVQPKALFANRGAKFSNPAATSFILNSVNGVEPKTNNKENDLQIFGRSVYVPAGEVTIDCDYYVLQGNKNFADLIGRDVCTFNASLGNRYLISYNLIDKKLEYKTKAVKR